MRTTTQLRQIWTPACKRQFAWLLLHSGARIQVTAETAEAWRAVDMVMQKHDYHPRSRDTGGFNCRPITGGSGYSLHAYGIAVDFNWNTNPYRKDNKVVTDMPAAMVDDILGIRTAGGQPVFRWGGHYRNVKDTMHYEVVATPRELGGGIDWGTVKASKSGKPSARPVLQSGDTGPSVRKLQELLAKVGRFVGTADGVFGPSTRQALIEYQQSRGLDADGICGAQSWTALLSDSPEVPPSASPVKTGHRVDPLRLPDLQPGDRGDNVVEMQHKLGAAGADPGGADGVFGAKTERALRAFQTAQHQPADGRCRRPNWAALFAPTVDPGRLPRLRRGGKGDPVVTLQLRLVAAGYDLGEADGVFGEGTDTALRGFQADRGLEVDGVCGPLTWAALVVAPPATKPAPPAAEAAASAAESTGR